MADLIKHTTSAPASLHKGDSKSMLHHRLPKTSVGGASLMIFKAIVGAGLFALPRAVALMGIGGAIIACFVVAWLSYYTSMVLVRVHDVVVRDTLKQDLTYVSVVKHCFGNAAAKAVYFLVVFTSIGSNGAYLVFIGSTLRSLVPSVSTLAFAGIVAAVMLPFCLMRNTAFLAYTSILGNLGVVLTVVAILVRGAELSDIRPVEEYAMFQPESFMQAFGMVGFLYACRHVQHMSA